MDRNSTEKCHLPMIFSDGQNHKTKLSYLLFLQYRSGKLCDIELKVGTAGIRVHYCVIVAFSPFFEALLRFPCVENDLKLVDMSESFTKLESLRNVIDYMYTGKLLLDEGNVEDILMGASLLMLSAIKEHCAQYLLRCLSSENLLRTWRLADLYQLRDLKGVCDNFICARFHDVIIHSAEILLTSVSVLASLLQDSYCRFVSEDQKLGLILRWLRFDYSRVDDAELLVKKVRLNLSLDEKTLIEILESWLPSNSEYNARRISRAITSARNGLELEMFELGCDNIAKPKVPFDNEYRGEITCSIINTTKSNTDSVDADDIVMIACNAHSDLVGLFSNTSKDWRVYKMDGAYGRPTAFGKSALMFHNDNETSLISLRYKASRVVQCKMTGTCLVTFAVGDQFYGVFRNPMLLGPWSFGSRHTTSLCKLNQDSSLWEHLKHIRMDTRMTEIFDIRGIATRENIVYLLCSLKSDNLICFLVYNTLTDEILDITPTRTTDKLSDIILLHDNFLSVPKRSNARFEDDYSVPGVISTITFDLKQSVWSERVVQRPALSCCVGHLKNFTDGSLTAACGSKLYYLLRCDPGAERLVEFNIVTGDVREYPSPPIFGTSHLTVVPRVGELPSSPYCKRASDFKPDFENYMLSSWDGFQTILETGDIYHVSDDY